MKNLLALIMLFVFSESFSQISQLGTDRKIQGEYYYYLPKNTIVIEGVVNKTTYKRAKDFVPNLGTNMRYFGIKKKVYDIFNGISSYADAKKSEDTIQYEYKIADIKMTIGARPDEEKLYTLPSKKKLLRNTTVNLLYGNDGLLVSGETTSESKAFDLAIKGLSGVATIIGAFAKNADETKAIEAIKDLRLNELKALLDEYNQFITTTTNTNFEVYQDKKKIILARIAELFEMMFYSTKETAIPFKITYTPEKGDLPLSDLKLFSFDAKNGSFTLNNDLTDANKLELLTALGSKNSSVLKGYSISLEPHKTQFSQRFEPRPADHEGFAYNVPEKSKATLKDASGSVKEVENIKLAQCGTVAYFNKKLNKMTVELDPLTGELKKISGEANTISGDDLASGAGSAAELIKAMKGSDETAALEAEAKKLELKKKIQDLRAEGVQ